MNSICNKKIIRSILSVICCAVMLVTAVPTAFAVGTGDVIGNYNYTISNPYASVNWDTWRAYKGATHVHTVRSDGNIELDDMIEDYYAHDYDCLALTDHGTVNYSWVKDQKRLALFGYQYLTHGNVDELSQSRYNQITTGSDRDGRGMIEIPLGIELNGSSTAKCHVNSYFADCGHGDLELTATWPEDAVKKSQNAGGLCHINHVGEWTEGKSDINTYNADFVSRFAGLFLNYSSCIGMELVNTTDNRTRNDRYLYDQTLKVTAPQGVPIWGFCEDDSHDPEDVGNNAQYFVMPQNTWQNVRTSIETGAFFACSKYSKNPTELGDGFVGTGDFPIFSRIDVDEEKDQISFYPKKANRMVMVADGNIIEDRLVSGTAPIVFDLNKYENQINSYVRFFATGEGGICYVQPFLLTKTAYGNSVVKFNINEENATLTLKDAGGNVVAPANESGEFVLPIGQYSYTVTKPDFESVSGSVSITDNSTRRTVDVNLCKILIFSMSPQILGIDYSGGLITGFGPGTTAERILSFIRKGSGVTVTSTPTAMGFGTGSLFIARDTSGLIREYKLVIFGDVNGDGVYDGQDAVIINAIGADMLEPELAYATAADCNRNGTVDTADSLLTAEAGVNKSVTINQQPA